MPISGLRRVHFALDCDCGFIVEGADDAELLDEVRAHIAMAHEADLRREPAAMLRDAYES